MTTIPIYQPSCKASKLMSHPWALTATPLQQLTQLQLPQSLIPSKALRFQTGLHRCTCSKTHWLKWLMCFQTARPLIWLNKRPQDLQLSEACSRCSALSELLITLIIERLAPVNWLTRSDSSKRLGKVLFLTATLMPKTPASFCRICSTTMHPMRLIMTQSGTHC